MKKILAFLMAVCLFTTLAACGKETVSDPDSVAYRLTGLDPAATLLTIEGQEVPVEMYLYWLQYAATVAANTSGCTDEEGNLLWDHELEEGYTVLDYVQEEAVGQAKTYMIVEEWAESYQVEFTQEDEDAVDEEIAYYVEQLGGEEAYQTYLDQIGISADANRRMTKDYYLYDKLLDMTKEEGSPLYITDDILYQFDGVTEDAVLIDHVLFFTSDDEEDNAIRLETMEQVRQSLLEADEEHRQDMFNYIADYYSEDTGRAYYPNGYLVTEDANFVKAFKEAALTLEEGELSEVVTSEYGYHLLMRKPIRDYVAITYLEDLLKVAMENAEVVYSEDFDKIDPQAYYTAYLAETTAAAEESQDTSGTDGSTDSAATEESAGDTDTGDTGTESNTGEEAS